MSKQKEADAIMQKINESKEILKALNLPQRQQNDMCSLIVLAMSAICPNGKWKNATNKWYRIHDMIAFANKKYQTHYAENSRETFRKTALHHFKNAAIVEDNAQATNSPNYKYRLTEEMLQLIRYFQTKSWKKEINKFKEKHSSLEQLYSVRREIKKVPIQINGQSLDFSSGKHNELQKAIIEEFGPRFAQNAKCIYIGDTVKKDKVKNEEVLKNLGFEITLHDKMPDIVLYSEEKKWLYFIEAVTSVGPMSPERILELKEMTKNVQCGIIFMTAFLDFKTYKKFSNNIAWETEVWITEKPDHMIHLNGDKFLGPRT